MVKIFPTSHNHIVCITSSVIAHWFNFGVGCFPASPHIRLRRQTHPAATIAKLPTQDNSAFVPIVGPTQSLAPQFSSFSQNDVSSDTADFPNLQSVPNTLVDYLVPPSPDSQATSLNFQDPAANLQNIDNVFEVTSPTTSPSNNLNTFQTFQNLFPPNNFHNQNQHNLPSSTTQSSFINEQVQSISFQNPSQTSTPSILSNPVSTNNFPNNANNFFSNKISNPLNRETPVQHGSVNQFSSNQFNIPIISSETLPKSESLQEKPAQQSNQGKWELGYDANEILAPPREEAFSRANDYDTINIAKIRRPNTNLNPPIGNGEPPINHIQSPGTQFFSQFSHPNNQLTSSNNLFPLSNSNFGSFSQFPVEPNTPINDPFIPIPNQFTPQNNQINDNQFVNNKQQNSDPSIIWGTQKQVFNPTTSAPFLPTLPPNTNVNGHQSFQNVQQSHFPNNGLNQLSSQQLHFQQPPPSNQQFFDSPNQNQPFESPVTSQFDSFLPQGTVSEHSYQSFNENSNHFQKKRQVNEEEVDEQQHSHTDEELESNFRLKHVRPVYSFVKTDKDGHFKWSVRHPSYR